MHFGGLEDDQEDSTAPHITFRTHTGGHRQCGLAICTFHRGFSLEGIFGPWAADQLGVTTHSRAAESTVDSERVVMVARLTSCLRRSRSIGNPLLGTKLFDCDFDCLHYRIVGNDYSKA